MRYRFLSLLLLPALALSSCVYGDAHHVASLGGKGAYKGADFSLVWNHEKSFRDGAVAAGLAIGAVQTSLVTRSNNALEATKVTSAATVSKADIAAKAAVEQAKISAQGTATSEAIGAGAVVNPITITPP